MRKGIINVKRGLAVLLSACMVFGMAPIQAGAEENGTENTVQTESASDTETIATVQKLIDALPDADSITEDNIEEVTVQLDTIDEAKAELSDADMSQLDLTRYDAAINKVMVLMGMKEENDSEIAVQANDSAGKTEQQSTDEASVTINEETLYYATLEDAFAAADGKTATITMLNDAECTVTSGSPITVMNKSNITLNMNGKTLSGHGTGDCGIITLATGSLSVQGPGTMKSTYMCLSCQAKNAKMTVENITFDVSEADYGVWVVSSNTVTLNDIQIIGKAETSAVYQYSKSANVTINNMNAIDGGYSDVCFKGNTLKINGGTFDKISVNSYYVASITSVSQVLGEGCIYRYADKTWETSELSNTLEISDVTVEKIPLTINPEAEATSWYYNSAEHSLQMNAQPTTTGNEITYEWYDGDKKLECVSDTYTVPKTTSIGSYTYTCKATCDGYTLSHEFTFEIRQSDTVLDGIKAYNGDTETDQFSIGDTIAIKATPTATGEAPVSSMRKAVRVNSPTSGQMALFIGDTQVSEAVNGVNGTYTMEVSASDVLLQSGTEPNGTAITLTAKFVGNNNMSDAEGTVDVNISASAKAEKDGAVVGYYDADNIAGAFAAENTGAAITLLDNVKLANEIQISDGTFTLDLNGHNINECAINLNGANANLTICGSGNITGNAKTVVVNKGILNVTDEKTTIQNLYIHNGTTVSLTAGTYNMIGIDSSKTFAKLLGTGCAYYKDGKPVELSELDGQTELTDTVTVKDCVHEGVTPISNHDGTHTLSCPYCGYKKSEAHTYHYETVENTTDKIKAACSGCEDSYTVQLIAPMKTDGKLTYTGTGFVAQTEITSGTLGETLPGIEYASLTGDAESAYSTDVPKNVGNYRAKLTLGSGENVVSATVDYTIAKATPVISWSDNQKEQSAVYTGKEIALSKITAPTVTLLNGETFSNTDSIRYSYREVKNGTAAGEFTSGLPTEIGTYEIKANIPADGNYTAAETTAAMQLTIAYLTGAPNAVVTDKNNKTYTSNDWCPSDLVLKAPDGYKISSTAKGSYEASFSYTGTTENAAITYYLKADNSGEIAEKSVTVKMDRTAPDFNKDQCGINIKKDWWNSLLSTITFGLYKGTLDVNIQADDSQSGVAEYYYYIDTTGSTTVLKAEELDTKTFTKVDAGKSGTTKLTEITSDNNYIIYAYAVDAAGNRSGYICSDGIVLDNTAPRLTNVSAPAKSNGTLSDTSAAITFTGSEAGTYYYILKESWEAVPTVMSDFALKTTGDNVDTWTAEDGVPTGILTADEGNTIKLTKLKANTSYVLYLAATDAAGNASVAESAGADGKSSGIVQVSFTTTKTIPYVKTAPVLSGIYGDTVSAMFNKADMTKASVTADRSSDTKIEGTWSLASDNAAKIPTVGTSEKYTLKFTPTGNDADIYDPVTCEVTSEVSKKPVTVVIADKERGYGEENPEFTWSLATGAAYTDNVLVNGDTETALGIRLLTTAKDNSNVGTYAVTGTSDSVNYAVSFTGSGPDGNSGVLTVKKQGTNEFKTALSCSDYTYAKDKTPEPKATAKFGTVTYKYAQVDSDGDLPTDESEYTDTVPVNAGTYAVKAYVAETDNYAGLASDPVVFTIAKAASPTETSEEKSYAYATGSDGKVISVDVAGTLPTDKGNTIYILATEDTDGLLSDVTIDADGELSYKVNELETGKIGKNATIKVTASMQNYEDVVYTMVINITNKKLVELKSGNVVSVAGSNALTYGDKLSKLTLVSVTFVEAGTNTEVKGTLEWTNPDNVPAAGTTEAGWVFKPADSKHYAELTGNAAITVAKATPAVVTVPTVAEREYNPNVVLTDSDMTSGSVTGADGNELAGTWSFTGTNIIPTVNNKGYQAVFTPTDTANYNTVTRTITVKVTKATPVIAENPTASVLTYGQTLSDSTLTGGKATYKTTDGTEVAGTFVWKNGTIKPTVADSGKTEYDVTFTPSDTDNYNVVDTKLTLIVNKAAKAPNMPGTAMTPAHSTAKVGDITLPDGWSWQEADKDTALADGVAVTATAVYNGADKGNYETESVSITIIRSECEHKNTEIINKKDATCSIEGYTGDTYCKDCGAIVVKGEIVNKLPHTIGTPATCVSKAICSVCHEAFGEIDKSNHVHTTVRNKLDATCTQNGYTGDTYCADCDTLISTGTETAKFGHNYTSKVTKEPTTTEEGVRTYTCSRCSDTYTESIAKLPEQHKHEYTETVTKEPTCTDTGIKTFTCSCGDSYTETISALGHSYTSKVTKEATTTEEGIMTYTCSRCGHSYTQPIAKIKTDDSNKDNGNQNQNPNPDTDNGKDNSSSVKPYIKDDSGKEGWDVIKPQLEKAKSGATVTVDMNGTTVVPKEVIDSIKGKDITLVLDMGNGLSWKINGKEITNAAGDIDFGVTIGADAGKSIPVDVINNVTGDRYSMNLTLAYDGEFGFTATLTVNMDSKNSGMYANLFYYNKQTGKLEFVSAGQIDADGNVELEFTHASDYTIVVDANIMSDNGQADNKAENSPAPKTDDSLSKYAWNNTIIIIIGICIILIVFGAVFYVRKKSDSEEE